MQLPFTIDDVDAELGRRSLSDFIRIFWRTADPSNYLHNWHIDAICEHLEAVSSGDIKRLIINIPPRHMKSLAVAVHWPAWDWITRPDRRWLFASYAQTLSIRDSIKCRRVIQSPKYQACYSDKFAITSDQNTKLRFENDQGGYRLATSVDGALTGEGGDFIVVDDAHNANEAESDLVREGVLEWWDNAMSTRLNDPQTGAYVVIMQRVHHADLVGHILKNEKGWEHLCLPAEYEHDHPTLSHTSLGFVDPRKKDGELLWPARNDKASLEELKGKLGSYGAAGQLQQRPSPKGGGILKSMWWRKWPDGKPMPSAVHIIQSYDTAYSEKDHEQASYSARTTWGIFVDEQTGRHCMMLLERWQDRVDYPVLRKKAQDDYGHWQPDRVLIEKKASGQSLIQDLRRAGVPVTTYNPDRDKVARAYAVSAMLESGQIWCPDRKWAEDVIDECAAFPTGEHNDLVDTCTQAWLWLRNGWWTQHPEDPEPEDPPEIERNPAYG